MKSKVLASLMVLPLLSSCALFNPSVGTAEIEDRNVNASGAKISRLLKIALQSKSSELAYWQAGSTVVMAGLIGYGGYKVVTDGGSHQVAALMAGGATLYGTNTVLYNPSREGMYARAVSSIQCMDRAFSPFNIETGLSLKENIISLSGETWDALNPSFQTAYSLASEYDVKYKQSVLQVVTDLNVYLADMQPSPENTYRILTRTIGKNIVRPDQRSIDNAVVNKGRSLIADAAGDAEKVKLAKERLAELSSLVARMYAWIDSVEEGHRTFNASDVAACTGLNINFGVAGLSEGSIVALSSNSVASYQILDSSGKLMAFVLVEDQNDAGNVSVAVTTNNGVFNLQVTAKTKTNKPVRVVVKDNGKFGVSFSFEVTVS